MHRQLILGVTPFGSRLGFAGQAPFVEIAEKATLVLSTVIERGPETDNGQIVKVLALPWFEIFRELERNPDRAFEFVDDPIKFEEFLAATYDLLGAEVELTPRSNDKGRDVIATFRDPVGIRVLDQAKAYSPGHKVKANDVRALQGVLSREPNASKAVITTTSEFAPGVYKEFGGVSNRLELRDRHTLLDFLQKAAGQAKNQ